MFIVNALGLSLSQLLGQNLAGSQVVIPNPKKLFRDFLAKVTKPGTADKQRLNQLFIQLIDDYDASRHFGPSKHGRVRGLTLQKTKQFLDVTYEIWDHVIYYYKNKSARGRAELADYEGIQEVLDTLNKSSGGVA